VRLRVVVLLVLLVVGAVSGLVAACAVSETSRAIWIGLSSTTAAAALVDGSALLGSRRHEQVLIRMISVRLHRINQRLWSIVAAVFDVEGEPDATIARLRSWEEKPIDLTTPVPAVAPQRPRRQWILECIQQIDELLDVVISLGAETRAAGSIERLDCAMRTGFVIAMRSDVPVWRGGGAIFAAEAAGLLEVVREVREAFPDVQR
jgi:hypothetical protein